MKNIFLPHAFSIATIDHGKHFLWPPETEMHGARFARAHSSVYGSIAPPASATAAWSDQTNRQPLEPVNTRKDRVNFRFTARKWVFHFLHTAFSSQRFAF